MKSSVLIADDEPLARRTLREHLRSLGWTGPLFEAHDGDTAITIAHEQRPDLIFLDIVMPGATGLEVLERLEYEPKVIFTTAYDQYAVTAFELGALDYLLKPFGRKRFERVFARAQTALNGQSASLLTRARESFTQAAALTRIFVRDGHRIVSIALAQIERIQGADDYVTIFAAAKEYLVGLRLSELDDRLSREHFLRIHRSHLINLEYVTLIEPFDVGRLEVTMKSGTKIVASRAGSKLLRDLAI